MYIFSVNIFGIHISPSYYGLMYAIGFLAGYYIIKKRTSSPAPLLLGEGSNKKLDDLLLYIFFGVILGGRFGYVLFYNFSYYINNLLDVFKVWQGGMSFHGGVIGVILAMILFSRKYKINFYSLADQVTLVLPIGLGLGRIGNYLNKELLGFHPYNGFLSIKIDGIGYFPSTLIEALLEGIVLFTILNLIYKLKCTSSSVIPAKARIYKKIKQLIDPRVKHEDDSKKLKPGQIASLFLIFYGIFRIIVEIFFRMPDSNIGYIFGFLTMGEILSLPMLFFGIYYYRKLGR